MARCLVYNRLLDAKTLPEFEHAFEFNTIVKIKEEVENDPLDAEIGQSIEPTDPETIGLCVDPRLELHSTNVPEQQQQQQQQQQQPDEPMTAPCPKLVIKFRDLWGDPENRISPAKRKKRKHAEIANDKSSQCETKQSKRRKTNLKVALKNRGARSSKTKSKSKSKVSQRNTGKQKGTFILSQKELMSEREEMQDIWNLTRITHLENNSQILCECCGRSFPTLRNLEAHIRYYTADGIFNCTLCNRKFNRNFQLKRHIKASHTDQPNRRVYKYKCQLCQDQFEKKPGLIAHVTHFHHQRVLLKRNEANWIRKKKKSLAGRAEKMKEKVPGYKGKFVGESSPKDNALSSIGKSFDGTNDGDEQCIPASLKNKHHRISNETLKELKNPEEIAIKVEYDEETHVEGGFDRRYGTSKEDEAIRRLQEGRKQQNQLQRGDQGCLNILSGNHEPQLRGNLVDHLGNTVGDWCVSKSFDQLQRVDHFSRSNSTSVKVSSAVQNRKIESSSVHLGSKSGAPKSVSKNRFEREAISVVSRTDTLQKVKAVKLNVIDKIASSSSEINNLGQTRESTLMGQEANVVESANTPSKISFIYNAQDVVSLKSFNESCKFKLKDVRVSLIKLEDMIDIPKSMDDPVEAKKFYCSICEKYFTSKRGLGKHCMRKHEARDDPDEVSELAVEETKSTDEYSPEALTNDIGELEEQGNSGIASSASEKHCYLCDKIFRNTFSVVSHLIAVHTDVGVFRCCLCHTNEKTSRKLRFHLYKHFNNRYGKNIPKSCVTCTKELNIFSLSPNCLECKDELKSKKYLNRGRVTRVQKIKEEKPVVKKKYVSLRKKFLSSLLKDTVVSGIRIADNESAKDNKKVNTEIVKNFKCLACNSVFLESNRLKQHLLTAHVDVEYCKRETRQNVESKIPTKNTKPKFKVGLRKTVKCKVTIMHDKPCGKQSSVQGKSKLFGISGKKEQCIRQRNGQDGTRTCYSRKCNVCGLKCCCRTCLLIHKRRYSSDGNNTCHTCGLTFAQKHLLAIHLKTAHNSKIIFNGKFKCGICTQGFYNKKFLRIHLAHFHKMKYLECQSCGIRFDSPRELNNHRKYYSEIGSCLCSICGQIFKCKYMLEYHNAQVHDYGELSTYKYSCDVCHCAFLDELLLQAHVGHFHNVKNHRSGKNVSINDLGQAREQNLEDTDVLNKTENDVTYSKALTNESTFQIDASDKKLQSVHPSIEYKCTLCKLSFTDPSAILNHEWEYSNDGEYTCDLCNRKFMTEIHLKNHKIKHYQRNAIRKYECYVCKEDFLRANDLVMHGLHLHGPQFILGKNTKAVDSHSSSKLNLQATQDRESTLEKPTISNITTHDSNALSTSNKDSQNGTVLLFRKMANCQSSMELLRRQSNEDFYCCEFCQTSFSSASLLKDHTKKHTYHAYYTNLSKYLCLICKKKFRTNDILRAHVIYFHKSDQQQSIFGKPGCSLPDESTSLEVMNISERLPIESSILDPTTCSKGEGSGISQPNITSPEKREQVSHPVNNINISQAPRVRRTYSAIKIKSKTKTNSECNDTLGRKDKHSSGLNSRQQINPEFVQPPEFESTAKVVKLFTIKVESSEETRKYTCIICVQTFDTDIQFAEHFTKVHVKDQTYVCVLCDERFAYMADLRHHIIRHERDPTRYMCCDRKFSQITGLIYHKLLHAKEDEKGRHEPDEESSPPVTVDPVQKSNEKINVRKPANICKCEICDAAFSDFKTLLKHWDACINKNCLQCDHCGARFKGENFLEAHRLSCKQNSHAIQKRCSDTVRSHISEEKIIINTSLSVNPNPFKEHRRCYGPANKLSTKNRLSNVKQNTNDQKECHLNDKQETNTNVSITKPRSSQAGVSSNQRNLPGTSLKKMLIANFERKITSNINNNKFISTLQAIKSTKQNPSEITREKDDRHSSSDLSDQDFSHVRGRSSVINNFSPKKKQKWVTPSLNTVHNSSSIELALRTSINVKNTRAESGQKSRENDGEDTNSSSSKTQSSNAANNQAQTRHSNERHGNPTLSNSPALPSTSKIGPTYYLYVQSTSNNSDESSNRTVIPNDRNLKFHTNKITNKQLLILLQDPSKFFTNPTHNSTAQELTDNSTKISNNNAKLNNLSPQSHTNVYKYKKAPIVKSLARNPIDANLHVSHEVTTEDIDSPTNDSASEKEHEPIVTSRNFRCGYCYEWFSEREELDEHMKAHKAARQCPACGIVFSNESGLRKHLPEHERSICKKCSMVHLFKDSRAYFEGTENHCTACKSLLPVPKRKSNHLRASSERQVMKCGVCMEAFDSMSKLSAHFRAVHLSFVCLICQARFSTKYTLRNHLHTHDKQHISATNKCKVCINHFAEEVNLEDELDEDALSPEEVQPDEYA